MDSQLLLESVHRRRGNKERDGNGREVTIRKEMFAQTLVSMTVAATLGKQD